MNVTQHIEFTDTITATVIDQQQIVTTYTFQTDFEFFHIDTIFPGKYDREKPPNTTYSCVLPFF